MFWLSDASLFERLAALVAGHIWHFTAWFLLFAIGLASGHARTLPILFAGLTGPALLILCAAIGTAAFALFPNEIDQRGPLAMLRLVVSWLFMIPAIVAGILSLVVLHSATAALAGAAIVALAEAGALIGFAAWRLDTSLPP